VLTVGRTQMTLGHATVCVVRVEKKDTMVVVVWRPCNRGQRSYS